MLFCVFSSCENVGLTLCAVLPVKIVKELEAVKTTVNERIELECEVSEEGAQVKWFVSLSLCESVNIEVMTLRRYKNFTFPIPL